MCQVTTNGYADFKLLDVSPWTPACASAAKSQALNNEVACADACLLNRWAFQVRRGGGSLWVGCVGGACRSKSWCWDEPRQPQPTVGPAACPSPHTCAQGISWAVSSGSDVFGWSKQ